MLLGEKEGNCSRRQAKQQSPVHFPLESGSNLYFLPKAQKVQGVCLHGCSSASSGCFQPSRFGGSFVSYQRHCSVI